MEKSKKGITVNHPYQWLTLICGACNSMPYIVREMEQVNFRNFETTMDGTYVLINSTEVPPTEPPSKKKALKGIPIKWKEIRAISFEFDVPFRMLCKYDLMVPWQCANIGHELHKVSS